MNKLICIGYFFFLVIVGSLIGLATPCYSQQQNPYLKIKDNLEIIDNGQVRVGVNLSLGGAITYLADAKIQENMVNNADWGRQIQQSFYSGPVPYTYKSKQPNQMWKGLGWNPIQSGDYKGNNAKILAHTNNAKTIYVKSRPMQWPLDNVPCDCTFETWITLDGRKVNVRNRLTNKRPDKKQYAGRSQELPAVYLIKKYNKIFTYTGTKPFTGDSLRQIKNSNPAGKAIAWATWEATENWSAAVDNNNYGIGIWNPSAQHYLGGTTIRETDKGTSTDYSSTYLAPTQHEILDHNIVYEYSYVLILGSLEDIRNYVYSVTQPALLPSYSFAQNRQHWIFEKTTDSGWPVKDHLTIKLKVQASLNSPFDLWEAEKAPFLYFNAAYKTKAKTGRVYFKKYGEKDFSSDHFVTYNIPPGQNYQQVAVPLHKHPAYKGSIVSVKIVPAYDQPASGDWMKLRSVKLSK